MSTTSSASIRSIDCRISGEIKPIKVKAFSSPIELCRQLKRVWSAETASPSESRSSESPVKSLQRHRFDRSGHFGGDILTTKAVGGTHLYNVIDARDGT